MTHQNFCERFFAALEKGDFETLGSMLAPDFVCHEAESLPYGGKWRGIDGWKALCKAIVTSWKGVKATPIEFLGETPDTIVIRLSLVGFSRRTGKSLDTTVLELWRFRDGQLREIIPYYWDTAALAAADRD
ncbi:MULTISPECIES: nuclear transport factor 2 family protein [unclassified Chelatococcus]|uniref:nuclear transport factor 2 family protein n=1 Tax=unclassified Chelatococcus TaxID=2638111 RepID=UPI001BCEE01B|nr:MULTISPECIES: nuclear transport factor 2 family protein [unclassified Chelatococcus]MBS7743457.1 nuclear transport factor 2 family protein [Chelatococcus sp. HY11]MBX3547103.1 nuclear transport factor 2 family protein [Chelatococcus sp.]CAH1663698.1 SnoaL-like domain-containing protein [Hyphomicrobiales bacterium]CAH1687843.1 SnoaL-like domain-containing protein [Hyphomicrobiales bacterium]